MREPLRESKCGNEANATSSCTNIQAHTQSDLFEGMGANSQQVALQNLLQALLRREEIRARRRKRTILDVWCSDPDYGTVAFVC
jgi:hypothetical protein